MEPFVPLNAVAAPLAVPNIDTDQIIPARFLWRKRGEGWGHLLFHDLRFDDAGAPRRQFVLNRPEFAGARILVADRNFGCWRPALATFFSIIVCKTDCCRPNCRRRRWRA
jgi:3-isopropylmalate/(R)-2-methylmalate dehydratase small subunit